MWTGRTGVRLQGRSSGCCRERESLVNELVMDSTAEPHHGAFPSLRHAVPPQEGVDIRRDLPRHRMLHLHLRARPCVREVEGLEEAVDAEAAFRDEDLVQVHRRDEERVLSTTISLAS